MSFSGRKRKTIVLARIADLAFSFSFFFLQTVASLESVGAPQATVVRRSGDNGGPQTKTIPVDEVVPGDIVVVKNGDIIPADGRIVEGHCSNLECDEAFLTGESLPVAKQEEPIDEEDCPVG